MTCIQAIHDIIRILEHSSSFRVKWYGWAPQEACRALEQCRLDRVADLARALSHYANKSEISSLSEGEIILGWAILGALLEASFQYFLSVYYCDYLDAPHSKKTPEGLMLRDLVDYFETRVWLPEQALQWKDFCKLLHERRNSIHTFQDREIGSQQDMKNAIIDFRKFLLDLESRIPYPDEYAYPKDISDMIQNSLSPD